jgi:3-oxoacyl-[acyl-carrier protein] reductase
VKQQLVKRSAEPSDLTGAVVFLASEDSDVLTGQTLNVHGGAAPHSFWNL